MILKELLALAEAKKVKAAVDTSPEAEAIAKLSKLAQPIGINGGSYTYRVDVTKKPLKFMASDGSVLSKAKTLRDIAKWMDDAVDWLSFLDDEEDLSYLIDYGVVRPFKKRNTPWSDQEEHELQEAAGTDVSAVEAKVIAAVLPRIMKSIVQHHDTVDNVVAKGAVADYTYDALVDAVGAKDWAPEHDALEKKFKKMRTAGWEAAFKAKYGVSDKQVIADLEKAGEKKFSADELKFLKALGDRLTQRVTIKDFDKTDEYHLRWYMKSPEKIVIETPQIVGQIFTNDALAKYNMDITKIKAMFERFGIKAGKRPVRKPASPAFYD